MSIRCPFLKNSVRARLRSATDGQAKGQRRKENAVFSALPVYSAVK